MSALCDNCTMSQIAAINYDDVSAALRRVSAALDAADCHGLLCGLICAAGFADQKIWVAEVFEAYDPKDLLQAETYRLLQKLYEDTLVRLNSPGLDFELMLPDAEAHLCERTESLANWCSAFLSGLGMGGLPAQEELSEEIAELLADLSQISRVDCDPEGGDEEDQFAFEEVAEYVRVGVLVIHDEMQPGALSQQTLQ